MALTVTRPDGSVGNILSQYGLGGADADTLARQATLQAIESATGKPVVNYQESAFDLSGDASSTRGLFEVSGTFGKEFSDLLTVEGNYTFHAKATYGVDCLGMREMVWSVHVDVGIDPARPPRAPRRSTRVKTAGRACA